MLSAGAACPRRAASCSIQLQGTFGFVGFNSERDADDAMRALNKYDLSGEILRVERTRDSMRPVTASGSSHAFNVTERCYNCGQYGHWCVDAPTASAHRRNCGGGDAGVLVRGGS